MDTPGVRRGGRRCGSRRIAAAYQDADRDPSSTTVSNRLRVAFITALLTAFYMELRRMVKETRGPASASRAAVSALSFPDPATGDCSGAPVKNSQLLVDGRQQLNVVFRRVLMDGVQ